MQHKRDREFPKQPTLVAHKPKRRAFIKAERSKPKGSLDKRSNFGYAAGEDGSVWILKISKFPQICVSLTGGDTKSIKGFPTITTRGSCRLTLLALTINTLFCWFFYTRE